MERKGLHRPKHRRGLANINLTARILSTTCRLNYVDANHDVKATSGGEIVAMLMVDLV